MIDPNDFLDAVEAYEEKRLAPAHRHLFEQQCQTDPALQLALDDYRLFRHSIESVGLKKRLDNIHTKLEYSQLLYAEPTQSFGTTRIHWGRWAWVAAASVALLLVGLWVLLPSNEPSAATRQTFIAFYRPEPIMRGSDCSPALTNAIGHYRAGHYQVALDQLPAGADACTAYYRGLCQLALNQPKLAMEALSTAQQQSTGSLRQRADWYLALAYLANNDPANARQQLAQITQQAGHPFGSVARQALMKLKE